MKIRKKRHPKWLKVPLPAGQNFHEVRKLINENKLHTVCQSAHCPNIGECWSQRTATFMILGDVCTRNCRFCAVNSNKPESVDEREPERIARAVKKLDLKYAVITSVTRDDLADGGASVFVGTISEIEKSSPNCKIEVLIPDFQGSEKALSSVFAAKPDVLNHNLETVPALYPRARPEANYQRSLMVLEKAKAFNLNTKSGLMLGLGETNEEVKQVMRDLVAVGCDFLTLGQYLQPSAQHLPIDRYLSPDEFNELKETGLELGFKFVEAGPLVRSSYHAAQAFKALDALNGKENGKRTK